jgi:hypothetical protein
MATHDRNAFRGPGLLGIVLGAVFGVALGITLACAYLVLKPVQTVKELPKTPAPFTVYYIEGTKNSAQSHQWLQKKKVFIEGESGTLEFDENELNTWMAAAAPSAKPAPGTPTAAQALLVPGTPNFRIRDGVLQIGMPCTLNALGVSTTIIAFARGGFVKKGDRLAFEPAVFYIGSCPLHRCASLAGMVLDRIVAMQPVPDDIVAAWRKLTDARVAGSTIELTLP